MSFKTPRKVWAGEFGDDYLHVDGVDILLHIPQCMRMYQTD